MQIDGHVFSLPNLGLGDSHWFLWLRSDAFSLFLFLQGNQEPTATPDTMVQPFTTIPFPPPPQNGIPTEYGVPHTQDYAGQTSEHNLTIYGSGQTHGEQNTNTATTQNGSLTVCSAPFKAENLFGYLVFIFLKWYR